MGIRNEHKCWMSFRCAGADELELIIEERSEIRGEIFIICDHVTCPGTNIISNKFDRG